MTDSGVTGSLLATVDPEVLDRGLKLWELQAEAAQPVAGEVSLIQKPSWVSRRVEQLEFLGTGAVRWKASIDFVVQTMLPWCGAVVRISGSSR